MLAKHEEGGGKGFIPIHTPSTGGKQSREIPDHLLPASERRREEAAWAGLRKIEATAIAEMERFDNFFNTLDLEARRRRRPRARKWQTNYSLANHSMRLATRAEDFAREVRGLGEVACMVYRMAAILHDVGKMRRYCLASRLDRSPLPEILHRKVAWHPFYSAVWVEKFIPQVRRREQIVLRFAQQGIRWHHRPEGIEEPGWLRQLGFDLNILDIYDALTEPRPRMTPEGRVEMVCLTRAEAQDAIPQTVESNFNDRYPRDTCGVEIDSTLAAFKRMCDLEERLLEEMKQRLQPA